MRDEAPAISWKDVTSGRASRQPVPVGTLVVGRRRDSGLVMLNEHVSGHHAELHWDGVRLSIRDLDSSNGTAVNDRPVAGWTTLSDGDTIRFGPVEAVVELPTARTVDLPPPATSAPPGPTGPTEPPVVSRPAVPLSQQPIFISHASEDKRAVRSLAAALRRLGWTVWIDEAEIPGGEEWSASLLRALEASWIVVLVVSHASMTSKWVRREIAAADRLGRRIIPVVIDPAPYPDDLRIRLAGVQQIDATGLHDSDRRQGQLARIDSALITAARSEQPSQPGRTRIVVGMTIMVIGIIGLVVGMATFVVLGYQAISASDPEPTPAPLIGFGIFFVSIIVAGIGSALHRSGRRKGI